jgi:hypothetical protein
MYVSYCPPVTPRGRPPCGEFNRKTDKWLNGCETNQSSVAFCRRVHGNQARSSTHPLAETLL